MRNVDLLGAEGSQSHHRKKMDRFLEREKKKGTSLAKREGKLANTRKMEKGWLHENFSRCQRATNDRETPRRKSRGHRVTVLKQSIGGGEELGEVWAVQGGGGKAYGKGKEE